MEKIRNWWNEKGKAQLDNAIQHVRNWWNQKGKAQLDNAIQHVQNAFTWCINQLAKSKINWGLILVAIALAYMGELGMLDKWPAIEWLVQCELRLIDWIFGLLKEVLEWATDNDKLLPNEFIEWVKYIFALS